VRAPILRVPSVQQFNHVLFSGQTPLGSFGSSLIIWILLATSPCAQTCGNADCAVQFLNSLLENEVWHSFEKLDLAPSGYRYMKWFVCLLCTHNPVLMEFDGPVIIKHEAECTIHTQLPQNGQHR
jgi:hypothetical protein